MKKPRMQTPVYNLLWKTTYANYTEGYGDLLKDHVFKFTGSKDHVSKPSLYRNDKIYMKKYSKKPHIQIKTYVVGMKNHVSKLKLSVYSEIMWKSTVKNHISKLHDTQQ